MRSRRAARGRSRSRSPAKAARGGPQGRGRDTGARRRPARHRSGRAPVAPRRLPASGEWSGPTRLQGDPHLRVREDRPGAVRRPLDPGAERQRRPARPAPEFEVAFSRDPSGAQAQAVTAPVAGTFTEASGAPAKKRMWGMPVTRRSVLKPSSARPSGRSGALLSPMTRVLKPRSRGVSRGYDGSVPRMERIGTRLASTSAIPAMAPEAVARRSRHAVEGRIRDAPVQTKALDHLKAGDAAGAGRECHGTSPFERELNGCR